MGPRDEEREVNLTDDMDEPLLPEQTVDDTDAGWGARSVDSNDARLLDDRPPHWD